MACLQESNFKCATTFDPSRWLAEGSKKSNYLMAPFGCGRRMCPGKRFMEQELQIALAKVKVKLFLDMILQDTSPGHHQQCFISTT